MIINCVNYKDNNNKTYSLQVENDSFWEVEKKKTYYGMWPATVMH